MAGKCALITGASSGIGAATARTLAGAGYPLVLVARRSDRLEEVARDCRQLGAPEVECVVLDLGDRGQCEAEFSKPRDIGVLVNGAGLALGLEPLDQGSLDDWEQMLEINVMGLLVATRLSLRALKKNRGHIVNLGSVAGVWTYPGGGVYCASKAAVRSITEGLRMDLLGSGVRVTNIEPGMVETEFSRVRFRGDDEKAKQVYRGMEPLTAQDIADCVLWSLSRPPRVNIQEMIVFPTDQGAIGMVHRKS